MKRKFGIRSWFSRLELRIATAPLRPTALGLRTGTDVSSHVRVGEDPPSAVQRNNHDLDIALLMEKIYKSHVTSLSSKNLTLTLTDLTYTLLSNVIFVKSAKPFFAKKTY
jgi:hypothetical protein